MARASLAQQLLELDRLTDPATRYTDLAIRLVVVDGDDPEALEIVEIGATYGGRWDNWGMRYVGPAERPIDVRISRQQYAVVQQVMTGKDSDGLISAGRGAGKSMIVLIIALCVGLSTPYGEAQFASPTYSLQELLAAKLLRDLPSADLLHPKRGVRKGGRVVTLRNGFKMRFGSADRPQSMRAGDADLAIVDERQDIRQRAVDIMFFQLRKRSGIRMVQIGTPDITSEFFDEYTRFREDDSCWTASFTSYDNPFIPHRAFEKARARMDRRLYEQEVEGKWVPLGDVAYPYFDWDTHVRPWDDRVAVLESIYGPSPGAGDDITERYCVRRFNLHGIQQIVGIDWPRFGVCYRIVRAPNREVGEIAWGVGETTCGGQVDIDRLCSELARNGWLPGQTLLIADSSDQTAESNYRICRRRGYAVIEPGVGAGRRPRNPDIIDRVNAVRRKLLSATGQPSLFYDPTGCAQTARLMQRQPIAANGKPEHDGFDLVPAAGYPIVRCWPAASLGARGTIRYA